MFLDDNTNYSISISKTFENFCKFSNNILEKFINI